MNAQPDRLEAGGLVDRGKPLSFTFNGRAYTGFAGDTLASALLANGVRLIGRSFKYHRPRGLLSAGAEEPNGLVQLETGVRTQPNLRATQIELYDGLAAASVNCWPSVEFDIGAINNSLKALFPAGFYYKTFMGPPGWHFYERIIRKAAGLGRAPDGPDPDRYERMNVHADVLVVGGGPAGLAAALAAGRAGARVLLINEDSQFGGTLLGSLDQVGDQAAADWTREAVTELAAMHDVRLLSRTSVFAYYDHNFLAAVERVTDHLGPDAPAQLPRQRMWRIRAVQVVLATGAIERPLIFANNDRPGVMLAGAARTYVNRYAVRPGRRAVVATGNDGAYDTALDLARSGIEVAAIVDLRPDPGAAADRARAQGIEVLPGQAVVDTTGTKALTGVEVMALGADGGTLSGTPNRLDCDLLAVSGGWNPAVHLYSQSRGKLRFDESLATFVPDRSAQAERSAGAAGGTFDTAACVLEGHAAGRAAAEAAGFAAGSEPPPLQPGPPAGPQRALWLIPGRTPGADQRRFVDLQNDVTAADVQLAAREGYRSVEHTKRYTTLGMGTDQGKTGNVHGLAILAQALDLPIPQVGTTTFRPPYTPVAFGALAGRDVGVLSDPVRRTPMHRWHEENGAVFEDVGQWKRPFYYPRGDENKHQAVDRECLAVRNDVGILDATTLGKIDIQGPDATTLLNRIYTNAWSKLEIGRCRYGLMLGEDGMVMDDGVTARLGENHFLMTTTTGNAARVLAWLEEWVQTEWPDLKVYFTSVTEQFATAGVAGPKARDLLRELGTDIPLEPDAFPFMSWRQGTVGGLPARVFRVSFTGEMSYEINVPASHGMALWKALIDKGTAFGVTPFGTEAMHVLRAEKGFIIVGQETDGTVTPTDLGMDWILSKKKDFIGRRSLSRTDTVRADRKQLVGLLTDDPARVLPEGGQITAEPSPSRPATMIGHVTSSYRSATLDRSIALALVRGGRARMGETVYVPLEDGVAAAQITDPVFYDKEGKRLHG